MIDLCGATLLWRSAEGKIKKLFKSKTNKIFYPGLSRSPTPRQLERALDELNAGRPQCPVGLHTLIVPRKNSQNIAPEAQPMVYLKCGHVQVSLRKKVSSDKIKIQLFFRVNMTGDFLKTTKIPELVPFAWEPPLWLNFAWVLNQVNHQDKRNSRTFTF